MEDRFGIFEELAACTHATAWLRRQGWMEAHKEGTSITVSGPLGENHRRLLHTVAMVAGAEAERDFSSVFSTPVPDSAALSRLLQRLHKHHDLSFDTGRLKTTPIPVPAYSIDYRKGRNVISVVRSGYHVLLGALSRIATEVFDDLPAAQSRAGFDDLVCRVQVGDDPNVILRPLAKAFGARSIAFFAHLNPDLAFSGSDEQTARMSTVFLSLFAAAGDVPCREQRTKIRAKIIDDFAFWRRDPKR